MTSAARSPIWHLDVHRRAVCPVCGHEGETRIAFEIESVVRGTPAAGVGKDSAGGPRLSYANCPVCASIFQLDFKTPAYTAQHSRPATVKFYVEQGAGLDILTLPAFVASRARRSTRRYLEVGCGFGFGLDFARHAFGWDVRGIDPAEHAREGRALLGVDIELRYLTREAAAAGEAYDAVAAVEVIEHMERPYEFLGLLKASLVPDGVLILTTPDAGYVEFGVDKPSLLSVLTPGYHAVIYSRASIAHLLHQAGFAEVKVEAFGATLIAIAGTGAAAIDIGNAIDRSIYRTYLAKRLQALEAKSAFRAIFTSWPFKHLAYRSNRSKTMLEIGLGYRLFKELINAGRYAEAEPRLMKLADKVLARDQIDIRDPHGILVRLARRPTFEEFVEQLPACLTGLLYFSAMLRLNHYEDRAGAVAFFYAAHLVAGRFRDAMRDFGIDDGETADLERSARKHLRLVLGWMGD